MKLLTLVAFDRYSIVNVNNAGTSVMKVIKSEIGHPEGQLLSRDELPNNMYWHGSPVDPEAMGKELIPRQAISDYKPHGPAASVSADQSVWFPTWRSLFKCWPQSPRAAGWAFEAMPSGGDTQETDFMVSGSVLRRQINENARGYLYGIDKGAGNAEPFNNPRVPGEVRFLGSVAWALCIEVKAHDLPDDLFVVEPGEGGTEIGEDQLFDHLVELPMTDRQQALRRFGFHAVRLGEVAEKYGLELRVGNK